MRLEDAREQRARRRADRPTARARRATPGRSSIVSVSAVGSMLGVSRELARSARRVAVSWGHAPAARRRRPARRRRRRSRRQRRRASSTPTSAAEAAGCDLVVFPELTVTGYPPEDLLLRPAFVAQAAETLEKLAARTGRLRRGDRLPRAPAATSTTRPRCARTARCTASTASSCCPNYAVFDEQRYFTAVDRAGPLFVVAGVQGRRLDLRGRVEPDRPDPHAGRRRRRARSSTSTRRRTTRAGSRERETMLATRAADASVPIVYANLVGGQDELVFDGASLVFDEHGHARRAGASSSPRTCSSSTSTCAPAFRKRLLDPRGRASAPPLPEVAVTEAQLGATARRRRASSRCSTPVHEVYEALVLGTRDYVRKNGFTDVLIGLSGGIDSSLVAAIAVDALGAEHVHRRAHAVALLERRQRHRRRGARRATSASGRSRCRSSPRTPRSTQMLAPVFAGTDAGPRRGEPPGAHPRQRADDDLEQVRLDGAHHRQQERDGHRLHHALRRHGRRVRGDQGRAEDARVRAVPRPQRARGPRA